VSDKGRTELLTSVTKYAEPTSTSGFTATRVNIQGEPGMKAVVRAVADQLKKGNLEFDLSANAGKPVTLLMAADNMLGAPMIFAWEGKPVLKPDTGQWLFMSKGSRKYGYRLNLDHVLDVAAGYNKVDHLRLKVEEVRAQYPEVTELTKERLAEVPPSSNTCSLAVFGTFQLPGMEATHEAVWLVYEYDDEDGDDIVSSVLFVPPWAGCSEHGSAYGRDLIARGSAVVGGISVPLKEALAWTDLPHEEVLAHLRAAVAPVAA